MGRLRVLLDGNSFVLRTGATHLSGIGRTTLELARALDELNDPLIGVSILTQTFRGKIPECFLNLPVRNVPWPIGPRFDWLRAYTPLLDFASSHDLLHIPHNFARVSRPDRTVVTIHDAMIFSYPEGMFAQEQARQEWTKFAQSCGAIAAPSLSAKADIVEFFGVLPEKVSVIPWGVDRTTFNAADKSGAQKRVEKFIGGHRPYFLSVSCSAGRKNTISVLRGYREALKGGLDHDLLLVWGNPPQSYLDEFSELIEKKRIRFLRHMPDGVLGDLYAGATASFFLSRYEGFGLPILESLACGTPVVTCNNSSLTEVGGEIAIYVGPDNLDDIVDLMRMFDSNSTPAVNYDVNRCVGQAAKFCWRTAGRSYLDFYKAAFG